MISHKLPIITNTVTPAAMKKNDIGIIRKWGVDSYIGLYVKKVDNEILASINTCEYWNNCHNLIADYFQIEILPKGTEITFTVE